MNWDSWEDPNIGLIGSLATYARVNRFGFTETPYRKVHGGRVTDQTEYLAADDEDRFVIAQANAAVDDSGRFLDSRVLVRSRKGEVEAWLGEFGIATVEAFSTVRRWSMACPAMPTCGLAVTEAERALPTVIDRIEAELDRLGLGGEVFTVRMTGCPNGCARPYNADIGLVGRSATRAPLRRSWAPRLAPRHRHGGRSRRRTRPGGARP